jgi:hypothetical protein
MTTNPITSKKLEEFLELCVRYNVGGKAHIATRAFLSQAIDEAYEAGVEVQKAHDRELIGQLLSPQFNAAKAALLEAQQQTAKEILEAIRAHLAKRDAAYGDKLHFVFFEGTEKNNMLNTYRQAFTEILALISSKYLTPSSEGETKNNEA